MLLLLLLRILLPLLLLLLYTNGGYCRSRVVLIGYTASAAV
jgi:hypothetical protein